ncbi:MAG TPA: phosphate acyltransferase PlsX [Rhizomicrobium sp.]|nr:phosphate acyltransferase PlsX [Rhizomicrobium sp.]
MNQSLTVSIDAMGGDAGPVIVVDALLRLAQRHPGVRYLLHGDEAQLKPLIEKQALLVPLVEIRHSSERVKMEDKPSIALRRGRNTSMWRAIECVAKKEAEVVVSAGNTGALMAMSMYQLGLIEGIERPAIAALWPTKTSQSVVLDVGATITSSADQLVDFAIMGAAFARAIFHSETPSVGLLNVGSEDVKGNDAVRGAAQILRNATTLSYAGFVEGSDISEGKVEVIVTDGFSGNIALKTAEGTAKLIVEYLRAALTSSFFGRLGAFIASGAMNSLKRKLDPRASNGGIFLGLNGVVVKSHGGTDALGFASALDMAIGMAKSGVIPRIAADRAGITPQPAATAVS